LLKVTGWSSHHCRHTQVCDWFVYLHMRIWNSTIVQVKIVVYLFLLLVRINVSWLSIATLHSRSSHSSEDRRAIESSFVQVFMIIHV
jgi:hypothetical protein